MVLNHTIYASYLMPEQDSVFGLKAAQYKAQTKLKPARTIVREARFYNLTALCSNAADGMGNFVGISPSIEPFKH